jgi:hypothetical protein
MEVREIQMKAVDFHPESMPVVCSMFHNWKVQVSNRWTAAKHYIEFLIETLLSCFAELKKPCRTLLRGFMQNHAGQKKLVQEDKKNKGRMGVDSVLSKL